MKTSRERLLMASASRACRWCLYACVIRPSPRRLEALHQRIREANEARDVPTFTPVGKEERAFLEDPEAPWRTRIPLVADDGARLAHANRVVSDLSAALSAGAWRWRPCARLWEPVLANFTLPAHLAKEAPPGRVRLRRARTPGGGLGPGGGDRRLDRGSCSRPWPPCPR